MDAMPYDIFLYSSSVVVFFRRHKVCVCLSPSLQDAGECPGSETGRSDVTDVGIPVVKQLKNLHIFLYFILVFKCNECYPLLD